MGGNSPSRFPEEDEGGGITFVKGIRLSDSVITRMKHSSKLNSPHLQHEPQTPPTTPVPAPSVDHLLLTPPPTPPSPPLQEATPPSVEPVPPVKLELPPPVKFHSFPRSSVDSAEPPPPAEPNTTPLGFTPPPSTPSPQVEPPVVPESVPPPPDVQLEVLPPAESFIPPHVEPETSTTPWISTQINEPVVHPPTVESSPSPLYELVKPTTAAKPPETSASSPPLVEPVIPSFPVDSAPAEAAVLPSETEMTLVPPTDSTPPPLPDPSAAPDLPLDPSLDEASPSYQCEKLSVVPYDEPVNDPAPADEEPIMTTCYPPADEDEPVVSAEAPPAAGTQMISEDRKEEELRQKIKAEMQRRLEEEINQSRQKLQQQLEEMRVQADAEAKAVAQAQVEEQVRKTLEEEKAAHTEKLMESIRKEKMRAEDEKLMVQLYWMELKAQQLEEKEKEMKKRDALYQEQVKKLEAKCSDFYKVSAENFQKGKEETERRFARFNTQPVCADLQNQIIKCYRGNPGKTLSCSSIASAYMQCVDNAKKVQIKT